MLIAATHHAREISTPVIALEAADRLTAGYDDRPSHHRRGERSRDLDRPGVESRRLQLRLHHQQPVAEEPPRLLERRRRRPEPELRAGMGHLVRRQHQRQIRNLQGALGRLGGGNPHDDDLVRDRAIRQGHRLPLLRPRGPLRVPMPEPSVHGLDAAGGRRALGGVRLRRTRRECPAPKASIRSGSSRRLGAYAFLIETHTEFQPSYASALERSGDGVAGDSLGARAPDLGIRARHRRDRPARPWRPRSNSSASRSRNGETNSSGGAFGSYHMFLPPGTYDVRFSRDGYAPVVSRVTVTRRRPRSLDVQLTAVTEVFVGHVRDRPGMDA